MAKPVVDTVKTATSLREASAEPLVKLREARIALRRLSALVNEARAQNDRVFPDMSKFILSEEEGGQVEADVLGTLEECNKIEEDIKSVRILLKADVKALIRDIRPTAEE